MAFTICFTLALLSTTAIYASSLERESRQTTVKVQNFKALPKAENDLITLPNAASPHECLQNCIANQGCGYVSYNHAAGSCQGFRPLSSPWLKISQGEAVLTANAKNFSRRLATDYIYGDILLNDEYYQYEQQGLYLNTGIYGVTVTDEQVCQDLCSVHPQCNAVTFTGSNDACYLKSLSHFLNGTADSGAVSYIS